MRGVPWWERESLGRDVTILHLYEQLKKARKAAKAWKVAAKGYRHWAYRLVTPSGRRAFAAVMDECESKNRRIAELEAEIAKAVRVAGGAVSAHATANQRITELEQERDALREALRNLTYMPHGIHAMEYDVALEEARALLEKEK